MKLLSSNEYKKVEYFLRNYTQFENLTNNMNNAIMEIKDFFNIPLYKELLDVFYIHRYDYKNRYPTNATLFSYLSEKLNLQEPTLYVMRKEIVYKSAMIFYKYGELGRN